MGKAVQTISAMLADNLASAAAQLGRLSENEAKRWAETQSERILQSRLFPYDELEQLFLDERAARLYWLHEQLVKVG